MVIFADGAPYHTSKYIRRMLGNNRVTQVINISWMPELNPIERVFGVLKGIFKKLKLTNVLNSATKQRSTALIKSSLT